MKTYWKVLVGISVLGGFVACSKVNFEKDYSQNACQNFTETCVRVDGMDVFNYSHKVGGAQVDILFVDDNSGSMSFEQKNMGDRFPNFLSSIDNLDYRIAVTTTDISLSPNNPPRNINQNGALQDGNLIPFPDGSLYMTKDTANKETAFKTTVQRPETKICEDFLVNNQSLKNSNPGSYNSQLYDNCPSPDERGIYGANLAIDQHGESFIRPGAHLAVVIISDEGNRSFDHAVMDGSIYDPYTLEALDKAQSLLDTVNNKYKGQKTLSVHAIIVKPNDSACLAQQTAQLNGIVSGGYGISYAQAATLTNGVIGSVCALDYGAQMGAIGANIVDQTNNIVIACSNPTDFSITPSQPYTLEGNVIKFKQSLGPNTTINLSYKCPTL